MTKPEQVSDRGSTLLDTAWDTPASRSTQGYKGMSCDVVKTLLVPEAVLLYLYI